MKTSEQIDVISLSLVRAQSMLENPKHNKILETNRFKTSYTTLDAIHDAIRNVLAKVDLAVIYSSSASPDGVEVTARLLHKGGQWMESAVFMPVSRDDAHAYGSALTYGRRYAVQMVLGLVTDADDDGSAASEVPAKVVDRVTSETVKQVIADGYRHAKKGNSALFSWWQSLSNDLRLVVSSEEKAKMKQIAAAMATEAKGGAADNNDTQGQ